MGPQIRRHGSVDGGGPARARSRWPMRDLPVAFWLAALLLVVIVHPWLPMARWLAIHLLLLGAVSHSILVWSKYFADALLHTSSDAADRVRQTRRLVLLNGGVVVVAVGIAVTLWVLVVVGAVAVVAAVTWHGVSLATAARGSLSARFSSTVRYYLAAASLLPVGVALGVAIARGVAVPWHARLVIAHAALNLLGWIGLTVTGTLVTLWPTMLRTRIVEGAEQAARRALPVLLVALAVTVTGTVLGWRYVAGGGLALYIAGLVVLLKPFALTARRKPPSTYAAFSVLGAVAWFVGSLVAAATTLVTAETWAAAGVRFGSLVPALVVGFALQVLLGALSYLLPVVFGGGPAAVRASNRELDRGGALRATVINLGLAVSLLPVPSLARVVCASLALCGFAAFLPLMLRAARAARRVRRDPPRPPTRDQRAAEAARVHRRNGVWAAGGVVLVMVAVVVGVVLDPAVSSGSRTSGAGGEMVPTGVTPQESTTVAIAPSRGFGGGSRRACAAPALGEGCVAYSPRRQRALKPGGDHRSCLPLCGRDA